LKVSSFFEEKEAKRLCRFGVVPWLPRNAKLTKVFWFFFPKKNIFLALYRNNP